MPNRARSLTEDLRRRSDDVLADLLIRRPDLARPAPGDLTTLVARATTPASVRRALEGLTSAHLATLEATLVAAPATLSQIAALLGQSPRSASVRALVGDLEALALIWRSEQGYTPVRMVSSIITEPGGLGPDVDGAPRGDQVAAAVSDLEPGERRLLDALLWGPPTGVLSERGMVASRSDDAVPRPPAARLLDRGLLSRQDEAHVVLPRSVALALRSGLLRRELSIQPPEPPSDQDRLRTADQLAGARAGQLIDYVAEVIDAWGADPPRRLRSGGLAVRDLQALADRLEIDRAEAAWLVETISAAGLVASTEPDGGSRGPDPVFAPTPAADAWLTGQAAQRWAELAQSWFAMSAAPWSVGTQQNRGGRMNALTVEVAHPAGRQRRQDLLRILASRPAAVVEEPDRLEEILAWHHPLRAARHSEPPVRPLLREAEWAGILAAGVMSTAGCELVRGGPAAQAMATHIPAAVDRVLVQADLTAIAPGRVDGALRSVLHLVSEIESRGGASVHRFTEASLRQALDAGWTADRIISEISAISATGIPQPLDYLIRDVARRHGVVRIGAAGAYIRSDEPALLDRMLADRQLSALNLQRIAPTVLIATLDAGHALELLRERAYGPVAESLAGQVVLGVRPDRVRAPSPARPVLQRFGVDDEVARQVVASMRAGEQVRQRSAPGRSGEAPSTDPAVTQSTLGAAAADGAAVVLGYADDAGGVARMLFWPQALEAGRVRGHLEGDHQARRLLLHRITGAHRAT